MESNTGGRSNPDIKDNSHYDAFSTDQSQHPKPTKLSYRRSGESTKFLNRRIDNDTAKLGKDMTNSSGQNVIVIDDDDEHDSNAQSNLSLLEPITNQGTSVVATSADRIVNNNQNNVDADGKPPAGKFVLDGVNYSTYQEMVQAKRQRNQRFLEESGLIIQPPEPKRKVVEVPKPTQRVKRRKSSRLRGKEPVQLEPNKPINNNNKDDADNACRQRINDGSDMSIKDSLIQMDLEEATEKSVTYCENFLRSLQVKEFKAPDNATSDHPLATDGNNPIITQQVKRTPSIVASTKVSSHSPSASILQQISTLSCNDERNVAKICPERICGIAIHPSTDRLIVAAGDPKGHIGIWNVDHQSLSLNESTKPHNILSNHELPATSSNTTIIDEEDMGKYLFNYHTGTVPCLQWTSSGNALMSMSYDGSVRWLDIEKEVSEEIFATYDTSEEFRNKLGYGLQVGKQYWTNYGCLDHRSGDDKCLFLATSVGTVMHLDLRMEGRITFHEKLSKLKINTISLHPNGYSFLTCGLDRKICVWDIRNFNNSYAPSETRSAIRPIAESRAKKSVNSVFFSPSGRYAVASTMENWIEVFENIHLAGQDVAAIQNEDPSNGSPIVHVINRPAFRRFHDNRITNPGGHFFSPFTGVFHPSYDIFCIGSRRQPRCIEILDPTPSTDCQLLRLVSGEAVTSVNSRNCFHPRTDRIILAGGDSNGRVTVVR